jgi:hypothetical protein
MKKILTDKELIKKLNIIVDTTNLSKEEKFEWVYQSLGRHNRNIRQEES